MKRLFPLLLCLLLLCGCGRQERGDTGTPPNMIVGDRHYWQTELYANSLPAGWEEGGTAEAGSYEGKLYYVHPDHPYWLYVKKNGTHRLLVDSRIWNKDLICYDGRLYTRLIGNPKTVNEDDWNIEDCFSNLTLLGNAEFTGQHTVPTGTLSSNFTSNEIYICPEHPDMLFVIADSTWTNAAVRAYEFFVPWTMPE